jgi:hypothetical protein
MHPAFLRKIPINISLRLDTSEGYGFTVNKNTNPIISKPDTIGWVISTEFFQVGNLCWTVVVENLLEYQRI